MSHYLSRPALSWDAILDITKVEFELISDAGMYLLFRNGIKGQVLYISKRYSKANKRYLKSYDPKQASKRIIYLDTNSLCDYAMSKVLPASRFKWNDPKKFNLNKYSNNSSTGCVLEVDHIILKNYVNYIMIIL